MKKAIIKIINCATQLLPEARVILTVNDLNFEFKTPKLCVAAINEILSNIEPKSFKVILEVEKGTPNNDECSTEISPFDLNWKTVQYAFTSDINNKKISNPNEIGEFFYRRQGDESFDIQQKEWFKTYDDYKVIRFNHFKYNDVDSVIKDLIELDELLDKQFMEKNSIKNKMVEKALSIKKGS